jgi:hypothetical protein
MTRGGESFVSMIQRLILLLTLAALAIIGTRQCAVGQNVGFLPGDAFFHFTLNERLVRSLPEGGGNVKLIYAVQPVGLGGYAGFGYLQIEPAEPELVQHLHDVYEDHRSYHPKIVERGIRTRDKSEWDVEMNAPHAFIYNRDADWSVQRIGLKYNKDWPDLPAEAFSGPDRTGWWTSLNVPRPRVECYHPLVKTYDAVVEDWRNAWRFKPLRVQVPKNIGWGFADGELIPQPVVARADDIQIVVTASGDMERYFLRELNVSMYQVRKDGVKELTWRKDEEGVNLEMRPLEKGADEKHPGRMRRGGKTGQVRLRGRENGTGPVNTEKNTEKGVTNGQKGSELFSDG